MRNTIITASYKLGYAIGRTIYRVLRIFKPVSRKETTFSITREEVIEFCLNSNKEFADTNPELVFTDKDIENLISLLTK